MSPLCGTVRRSPYKGGVTMDLNIFSRLLEYFGIFCTNTVFVPFFCGGAVALVAIRAIGRVINKGVLK